VDAGLFVIAILLFYTIKIDVKKVSEHSLVKLIKDGFFYLKEHKLMIHLIILHALVAFTSFDALINLLADYEYKEIIAIPLAIGWLNAVRAFGLVIGPLFIGKIIDHTNLHKIFFLQGVVVIVWAFVQKDFYMSILSMVFIGFFTTTLWSYTYTLIQTHTQKEFLGRVVAYNDMIFMSVSILVSIFIGVAYKSGVSLQMISFTLGFGFIVGGIYYMWFKNRYHDFLESKSD
jgi:MFS family permease